MASVVLDAGTTARLIDLAGRAGVRPETVALTGVALLLRRYTGVAGQVLRWNGTSMRVDLPQDEAVATCLGRPTPTDEASTVAGGVELDGPQWRVWWDCDDVLTDAMEIDAATLFDALPAASSTVDLLPVSYYERRPVRGRRPTGGTIPAAFAAMVERYPDRPAVLADNGSLTYRELGSAVAVTAAALGPGGPVGLLCRHGKGTVTGLLGALAAGRPYVPLDPSYPEQRLAEILGDSGADTVLVDEECADLAGRLTDRPVRQVHIGQPDGDAAPPVGPAQPDDPAYILYTSGSTGQPKGVVQSHRNVLFGVSNHVRNFHLRPADRTSVLTSFGFDMAVTDTFSAILSGAAAVPIDIRTYGLSHLAEALAERGVTIYHSTPTVYRYLAASLGPQGTLPAIRAVLLGGEEVTRRDVELARRLFAPDAVFVNGYGATEISFAAQYHLPPEVPLDQTIVPIGYPLDGIDVILVDPAGRPTCLTGEVLVRCPHVALGYWRRDDLTAQRFVEYRGMRAYRTGDVAQRLPDGRLVFLGRADRMVKIRGHRVELGEIEVRLAALPGVGQAAVVAKPNGAGEKDIVGYVVPMAGHVVDPAALRTALAMALPEAMVPRALVTVDALPMGLTGKLDVSALPLPPDGSVADEPSGPIEEAIGAAWRDVLGLARVDRHASFVALGGHSLQAALVQQRLEEALGRRLPLARLFEYPTIAGLAAYLDGALPSTEDVQLTRAVERMRRRRKARQ